MEYIILYAMNLFNASLLGFVEGVTEFLPISSTAHLILTSKFLHIPQTQFQKFFEVFIQSGAILAVVFLYIKYIFRHREIVRNVLISFFPTAITGFILYKAIKTLFFESTLLISFALISFGIVFLLVEYLVRSKRLILRKPLRSMNAGEAVIIGLSQSLAVVPGVSRSGAVMLGMMGMGFKREESALYSFLLAVPTILAASLYDIYKVRSVISVSADGSLVYLAVGFLVSFVTAYISMKWLISYLQKKSLDVFGVYRICLGVISIFVR